MKVHSKFLKCGLLLYNVEITGNDKIVCFK